MQRHIVGLVIVSFCWLFPQYTWGYTLEPRVNLGLNFINPEVKDLNATTGLSGVPDMATGVGFGIDGMGYFFSRPIGLGLRFENWGSDAANFEQRINFDLSVSRLSLTGNYRLNWGTTWFGPIVSAGILHVNEFESVVAGSRNKYSSDSIFSLSIGAEAGVSLNNFIFGGELGYLMMNMDDPDNNGAKAGTDIDLSGVYIKIMVGYRFELGPPKEEPPIDRFDPSEIDNVDIPKEER